eukprot:13703488-Ditylum_brightwellii.AAC.1
MFFRCYNGSIQSRQGDGIGTRFEGVSNVALKIFFDVRMTELATVDDRWADGSFTEDLLATEQTASVFAEC